MLQSHRLPYIPTVFDHVVDFSGLGTEEGRGLKYEICLWDGSRDISRTVNPSVCHGDQIEAAVVAIEKLGKANALVQSSIIHIGFLKASQS